MENNNTFAGFTNLYSLSKTLRFELVPVGETKETFEKWIEELKDKDAEQLKDTNLIAQDQHRAESYKKVKKIIDKYHKVFIEQALSGFKLDLLDEYFHYYHISKKEIHQKEKFEEIQTKLRKQIAERFSKNKLFSRIDKKELIKEDMFTLELSAEEKIQIKEFENFTTYFSGYHINRKNMYSAEAKSTAISFRLIHQNLPKFIENIKIYEKIKATAPEFISELNKTLIEMEDVFQGNTLEEIFSLNYFNETLTQTGIELYNTLIGGRTEEDGKPKIKGLNEYINTEYNQKQTDKNKKLPIFIKLFKQILSDQESTSFKIEEFSDDNEVLKSINDFYQKINDNVINKKEKGEHSLKDILKNLNQFEGNIYVKNDEGLTTISQKIFKSYNFIENAWIKNNPPTNEFLKEFNKDKNKGDKLPENEYFKSFDSFTVSSLNNCIKNIDSGMEDILFDYFEKVGEEEDDLGNIKVENLFDKIEKNYNEIKELYPYPKDKNLAHDKEKSTEKIKLFLDSLKELQWFVKPLLGNGDEPDKDEHFYGEFAILWEFLDEINPLYNKVRNYMTRKPFSQDKIKLNFENPELLGGWPIDREIATSGVIFKDENFYYLGILDKKDKRNFKNFPSPKDNKDILLKMNYLQAADPSKDVQNLMVIDGKTVKKNGRKEKEGEFVGENLQLEKLKNCYLPEDINLIRKNKSYSKQNERFNKTDLIKFIDYYKQRTIEYFKSYNFEFKNSEEYKDFGDFTDHINQQAYQINFIEISKKFILKLVNERKIYLFKIYNKDFSPNKKSKGTDNMHTLYWKMLFDPENLKNVVYKLNGQAEIFFRKASINDEQKTVHYANVQIPNKNELNEKKQSKFEYDIIKDKRYTIDKFQFHVPITLNFKAEGVNNLNLKVNTEFIKKHNDIHIIGIDRGERHLLYLTLIDLNGNIKKQFTLNEIVNEYNENKYPTNYRALLNKREGDRAEARKNWKTIETIKELKEGYLSQVIHKITQLMVEYNAIVVLEDLNMGFMRGRQKVEKQVYQKFEKMLIDKLNYLVDKKKNSTEFGGVLNAYQLTDSYADFMKYKKKQCGFLYYVPSWNTSKIDPVTGFVNLFDARYESIDKAKTFFNKFDFIKYNQNAHFFEFWLSDYASFNPKAENTRQNWTICTYGERIETFRNPEKNNQWDNREVLLTKEFKNLFAEYKIDFSNITCIKQDISKQSDKSFFEKLLYLFRLTLQMRNSISNSEVDYMISPVADENGVFFDSRNSHDTLPENADANGAFNIARKGIMLIKKIKEANDLKKPDLIITNKEWLQFAQKQKI